MKTLIAANWKMNGSLDWAERPAAFEAAYRPKKRDAEILICPPSYLIPSLAKACEGLDIGIGAQNCHFEQGGAFTGEMSAAMVKDAGGTYVILGHSERRALFGETDHDVVQKAVAVMEAGLCPIICVGESLEQRQSGQADEVVGEQLRHSVPTSIDGEPLVIAYEPVWAIGTGLVPSLEDIAAMHDHIRGTLAARFGEKTAQSIRILYGGSVKPSNAKEILALGDVNGALIGGAGLDMDSLAAIAMAV